LKFESAELNELSTRIEARGSTFDFLIEKRDKVSPVMTAIEDLTESERAAILQARSEERALRAVYASAASSPPSSPSYTVRQITNADGSRTVVEELFSTTTRKISDSGYAPSSAPPPPAAAANESVALHRALAIVVAE
jgi:hypothetical protein